MDIKFSNAFQGDHKYLVFCLLGNKLTAQAEHYNKKTGGALTRAIEKASFDGKAKETIQVFAPAGVNSDAIVLVGLGKEQRISAKDAQAIGGHIATELAKLKAEEASVVVDALPGSSELAAEIAYGMHLKSYRFDRYKKKKKEEQKSLNSITILTENHKEADKAYQILDALASGVFLARDVVTEPPNELYPESYAERIKKDLSKLGVGIKVLGEKQMAKLNMGALLGVGQGSIRESQLVVMHWKGNKSNKDTPLALVGKGVTFDTGGISLKPSVGMWDMKYDMGGSAAVVGTMKALAARKAPVNVVGIVGLVENMPGHNAQRPSDVVDTMSGQTVEVLNTDAEGRLVLADALWYAQDQFNPGTVINLATLTGAIVIALGDEYAGLFSNNDDLSTKLAAAGEETDEKVWRFPMGEAYDKLLDSPIADIQNIHTGRGAGSITAAQFLKRFIQEGVAWAHLDIAGVAWAEKEQNLCPKGATGFGVRLLNHYIKQHFES